MLISRELEEAIVRDYKEQNISRLREWFRLFPNTEEVIRNRIGGGILKQAMIDEKWLLSAYLMKSKVSEKGLQAQHGIRDEHWVAKKLVKANLVGLDKDRLEMLSYLQDRVKV
tara:strand:+ start:6024 stop:6362 length:339 start_codon:yes stop_codon:yes gene_type:complete